MKNRNYFKGVVFVLSLGSGWSYAKNLQTRVLYASQEEIDGITFGFQEENVNGVIRKQWVVDGSVVCEGEYHDELERAEMNVRRKERMTREQARVREQEDKQEILKNGYKKVIKLLLDNSVEWMKKIMHADVAPYCTTANRAQLEIIESITTRAHCIVYGLDREFDQQAAQEIMELLEPVPQQLKDLFYQVVNGAIQQCDDTKVLKGLLELVGHE